MENEDRNLRDVCAFCLALALSGAIMVWLAMAVLLSTVNNSGFIS